MGRRNHIKGHPEPIRNGQASRYSVMSLLQYLWMTQVRSIEKPLNYLNYDKEGAKRLLRERYG